MRFYWALGTILSLSAAGVPAQQRIYFNPGGDPLRTCSPAGNRQKDTVRIHVTRASLLGNRAVVRVKKATEDDPQPIPNPPLDAGYHTVFDLAPSQNSNTALSAVGDWIKVKIILPPGWHFYSDNGSYDVIRVPAGTAPGSSLCGPVVVDDTRPRNTATFKVVYTPAGLVTPYNIGIMVDSEDDESLSTPIFIDPKIKDHG